MLTSNDNFGLLQLVDKAVRMSKEGQVGGEVKRQQLDPGEGGSGLLQHQHHTQEGPVRLQL